MSAPSTDPIEYLVRRKFFPNQSGSVVVSRTDRLLRKATEADLQVVEAYRAELMAKSPEELNALYEAELHRDAAEKKAKADLEEQKWFFNHPSAKADFDYWSRMAHWTLDEAVALSFGRAPEKVSWEKIKSYQQLSPFVIQYGRVLDLARRAQQWSQLFDPVLPGLFLAWAKRTGVPFPNELEAAVVARGIQVTDWKTRYDDLTKKYDAAAAEYKALLEEQRAITAALTARLTDLDNELRASKDAASAGAPPSRNLSTRERDSLLKLVIGMAVGAYRYDPLQKRSDKLPDITSDLERAGVPLDADTVRKWLKQGAELLPRQTE